MGSSLLCCLLYVQFITVLAKIVYNTYPEAVTRFPTPYDPKANPKVKMCFLKPDSGPCRANIKMYYFDPEINNCSTFHWGGCQGNGNRFDSRSECHRTCFLPPNYKSPRPRFCALSFDYGFCFGALKRWYYDKTWKICKETIYSGCGGNKNNFYSYEQCDTICRLGNKPLLRRTTRHGGKQKKFIVINPYGATSKKIGTGNVRSTQMVLESTKKTNGAPLSTDKTR